MLTKNSCPAGAAGDLGDKRPSIYQGFRRKNLNFTYKFKNLNLKFISGYTPACPVLHDLLYSKKLGCPRYLQICTKISDHSNENNIY